MLHDLVVGIEFPNRRAELEQQTVGVIEIYGAAPFVIDNRGYIDAFLQEVVAARFEFVKVCRI